MSKATRQAFGEALARLGEKHSDIVVLDADLSKSTKSEIFAKKFPDRFFEMGIAEANMIGTAAGLAFAGKLPFLCSFGAFTGISGSASGGGGVSPLFTTLPFCVGTAVRWSGLSENVLDFAATVGATAGAGAI